MIKGEEVQLRSSLQTVCVCLHAKESLINENIDLIKFSYKFFRVLPVRTTTGGKIITVCDKKNMLLAGVDC